MSSCSVSLPEWRPKLVALDLDGTLVPPTWEQDGPDGPSLAVREALARVLDSGTPVVVATGRSVWNTVTLATELGLAAGGTARLVCSNGAVGYELGSERVTHRETFDPAPTAHALAEMLPDAVFAAERGIEGFHSTAPDKFPAPSVAMAPRSELLAQPTSRVVCWADGHPPGRVVGLAAEVLADFEEIWTSPRDGWVDVGPPAVTKATGVSTVAAEFRVAAEDVLALGDGMNDLSLFAAAGCSVAMGQAPEYLRRAADYVTADIRSDGAADALNWWFARDVQGA